MAQDSGPSNYYKSEKKDSPLEGNILIPPEVFFGLKESGALNSENFDIFFEDILFTYYLLKKEKFGKKKTGELLGLLEQIIQEKIKDLPDECDKEEYKLFFLSRTTSFLQLAENDKEIKERWNFFEKTLEFIIKYYPQYGTSFERIKSMASFLEALLKYLQSTESEKKVALENLMENNMPQATKIDTLQVISHNGSKTPLLSFSDEISIIGYDTDKDTGDRIDELIGQLQEATQRNDFIFVNDLEQSTDSFLRSDFGKLILGGFYISREQSKKIKWDEEIIFFVKQFVLMNTGDAIHRILEKLNFAFFKTENITDVDGLTNRLIDRVIETFNSMEGFWQSAFNFLNDNSRSASERINFLFLATLLNIFSPANTTQLRGYFKEEFEKYTNNVDGCLDFINPNTFDLLVGNVGAVNAADYLLQDYLGLNSDPKFNFVFLKPNIDIDNPKPVESSIDIGLSHTPFRLFGREIQLFDFSILKSPKVKFSGGKVSLGLLWEKDRQLAKDNFLATHGTKILLKYIELSVKYRNDSEEFKKMFAKFVLALFRSEYLAFDVREF